MIPRYLFASPSRVSLALSARLLPCTRVAVLFFLESLLSVE